MIVENNKDYLHGNTIVPGKHISHTVFVPAGKCRLLSLFPGLCIYDQRCCTALAGNMKAWMASRVSVNSYVQEKRKMRTEKMNGVILVMTAFMVLPSPVVCAGREPAADLSFSLLSAYIWRGFELSRDSMVVQPSTTFSWEGFSANLWANWDTDLYDGKPENLDGYDNYNETDITFSYSRDFGMVSAEAGYIYYALDKANDSQEFYVAGTLNVLLSPTLTVYREFAHYPCTYIELAVSRRFSLPRQILLNIGLSGSYLDSDDRDVHQDPDNPDKGYSSLHDGKFSVSMEIPLTAFLHASGAKYFTISPEVNWVFPLSGDASKNMADAALGNTRNNNFIYGGATFSFSF